MFISANGVLFDQDGSGAINGGSLPGVVTATGSMQTVIKKPLVMSGTVEATGNLIAKMEFKPTLPGIVTTDATMLTFIPREVPITAKYSSYTISPAYRTHTDYAADNLLAQFQGCPNIEKLLEGVLLELDKAQTDVYDFQDLVLNIEKAEGVNLDICGEIVGLKRLTGQGDLTYRNQIYTQIYTNICDGSIPKILAALLTNYNLIPGPESLLLLQLKNLPGNHIEVYIKDLDLLNVWGGKERVYNLIAAGGTAQIVVQDRFTDPGDYFSWGSLDGTPDINGGGYGSLDSASAGGTNTGLYNSEDFAVEGKLTGDPLRTTNKEIPVDTFP